MLNWEATDANFPVFDLTQPQFEPLTFQNWSKHSTQKATKAADDQLI